MTTKTLILLLSVALLWGCPEPDPDPDPEGEWSEAFNADGLWLLSIAGAPDDLYAVGGSPTSGEIRRFDGESWSDEDVSAVDVPLLNWVHRFDDGTAFVAGNNGTILRGAGAAWELMETPTDEDLWGVWGASPNDVWAVGGRGSGDAQRVALRFDGTEWTEVNIPLQRPGVNAFFKVWGSSADDVWIVGQNGAIVQWNGTEFVETGVGFARDLISVWGTGPNDVYVVGGRGNGVVARWDGTAWTAQDIAPAPGLNGVWAGPDGVWVAGARGTLRQVEVADDGSLNVPRISPINMLDLHAVFGTSDGALFTVGGNFQQPQGPYEGVALENRP
jgi:hypothetical protein